MFLVSPPSVDQAHQAEFFFEGWTGWSWLGLLAIPLLVYGMGETWDWWRTQHPPRSKPHD